jgi:RNA polymerase sigma-70 factor (ECF subfamily)
MATVAVSAMLQRETGTGWRMTPRPVAPTGNRMKPQELVAASERTPVQEVRPVSLRSPQEFEPQGAPLTTKAAGAAVSPDRAAAMAEQRELADLAARCLAGDGAAWERLARTQHRRVYGICYRFTGSQADAEDMTQEAFLKMYRNLGSFDATKGGFTTWLTTLTRNLLVDNYRRSRMDRASDSLDETYDGEDDGATRADKLADGGKSQEQIVSGQQLRVQIQAALKQVSPELREAVILRDLEDMDYKDIAEVLGVPQGTVKSRISRGRAELARLLKRLEGQVM